ncbi:MAG: rod shape-determining protein MreC [bacterium]
MQIVKKILISIIFIILIFFISKQLLFFKKTLLDDFTHNINYPTILLAHKLASPFKNFWQKKTDHKNLIKEYEALKEKYDELIKENIELKSTINHQKNTDELTEFQQRYNQNNTLIAKVLLKNITESEQFFLINRGKNDEIKKDTVAIYKNQIIGRVTDVFSYYSKILLITDSNSKISAYTEKTKASGIVNGLNDITQCQLGYVNHLSKIQDKDLVISSGQGLIYPEGFALGKITKFNKKDLYYDITIKPLFDLKNIDFCLLLKQSKIKAF